MQRSKIAVAKKPNYTVHPAPYAREVPGFREFPYKGFVATFFVAPLAALYAFGLPAWSYPLLFIATFVPSWVLYVFVDSILKNWAFGENTKTLGLKITDYMSFKDNLATKFTGNARIPMQTFYEAYFDGDIEIHGDMLDMLENRHDWASFRFTLGHGLFLLQNLVPEALFHSRSQDESQVREHYDRGNDFYSAFLGPMMIYTSGIITDPENRQSLEELQLNKLNLVCKKIQLQKGEKMLDIGCGWGTLLAHAAKEFGAEVTGVTLAREQTEFGLQRAKEYGVADKVRILCHDYRDIPRSDAPNGIKYDKITCLEMAEHVGIRKFNRFLAQVDELLKDDGIFYLQIAGLRRPWQYEDLSWGLFMNKYVFPGADASCPLAWVVNKLEYAGFEVVSMDTIGVHYSATIERWYRNWCKPEHKERIVAKYGIRAWKVWEFFLAWSTVISRQGSATCYQLVCHKNRNTFDRTTLIDDFGKQRLTVKM